jgi:uncharacterized membrane protein (DUF4010 family)
LPGTPQLGNFQETSLNERVSDPTLIEKGTLEKQGGKMGVSMRFLATPHLRRNTLALGLCLLTVLFALEAKTAWFGPTNGPSGDIQSQKARPADLPAVVSQGVSALSRVTFPQALVFFASIAAIAWTNADFLRGVDLNFDHTPVSAAPYFSPGLFFRPPPSL